uniref:ATPase AAA-type core domain-containing protein n=1 Tax=Glossina austeni TaxID=7395 RepID=A0A1A9UCZ2_GLOAU
MLLCAIALMGDPRLIILDMASDSIDSAARLKLWQVLRKARSSGTSILCTSNKFDEMEPFCKRSVMLNGRLCVIAPPMELDISNITVFTSQILAKNSSRQIRCT